MEQLTRDDATAAARPILRAAISLRRNQPDKALAVLQLAMPIGSLATGGGFWLSYMRGQVYLRLGDGQQAATEFRKIIDHRGWNPISPFYPLAHLGLARATALMSDSAASRNAYEDFFRFGKTQIPICPLCNKPDASTAS